MRADRLARLYGRRVGPRAAALGGSTPTFLSYAGVQSVDTNGFMGQDNDSTVVAWGTTQNPDVNGQPQNNYDGTDAMFVRRSGFDGVASAANPVDTVYVMSRMRQRYNSETSWTAINTTPDPDEAQCVFSEFIFSTDEVYDDAGTQGGVTNNSTRTPPLPIPMWLHAAYTRVADGDKIRLYVDHAYARSGQSVAAARITVSDGSNSETYTATVMAGVAMTGSGLYVPCFEFTVDWTAFDAGLCTIDAEIWPYVGAKYQASVDGSNTTHTANFGVLRVWNTEGDTIFYAYVDPTTPSGTPTISSTPATAAADPYDTIANAMAADNTAGGGTNRTLVIRLVEDTHTLTDTTANAVSDAGVLIEGAPGTTKANVIVQHAIVNDSDFLADILHFKTLTIDSPDTASNYRWTAGASKGSKHYCCYENIDFTSTGGAPSNFNYHDAGILTFLNCSGDDHKQARISSGSTIEARFIGCAEDVVGAYTANLNCAHQIVGCSNMDGSGVFGWSNLILSSTHTQDKEGAVVAFNEFRSGSGSVVMVNTFATIGARGTSLSGNVLVSYGTHSERTMSLNADLCDNPAANVVCHQVTCVGDDSAGRLNVLYAPDSTSTDAQKYGYFRNCIFETINTKSDVFENDGTSTGNEAVFMRAGFRNIMVLETSAGGDYYAPGSFLGEVKPKNWTDGRVARQNPGFIDDGSHSGGDDGTCDMRPTAANMANDLVPANDVAFPCDINGATWAVDGTDVKGALVAGA